MGTLAKYGTPKPRNVSRPLKGTPGGKKSQHGMTNTVIGYDVLEDDVWEFIEACAAERKKIKLAVLPYSAIFRVLKSLGYEKTKKTKS